MKTVKYILYGSLFLVVMVIIIGVITCSKQSNNTSVDNVSDNDNDNEIDIEVYENDTSMSNDNNTNYTSEDQRIIDDYFERGADNIDVSEKDTSTVIVSTPTLNSNHSSSRKFKQTRRGEDKSDKESKPKSKPKSKLKLTFSQYAYQKLSKNKSASRKVLVDEDPNINKEQQTFELDKPKKKGRLYMATFNDDERDYTIVRNYGTIFFRTLNDYTTDDDKFIPKNTILKAFVQFNTSSPSNNSTIHFKIPSVVIDDMVVLTDISGYNPKTLTEGIDANSVTILEKAQGEVKEDLIDNLDPSRRGLTNLIVNSGYRVSRNLSRQKSVAIPNGIRLIFK